MVIIVQLPVRSLSSYWVIRTFADWRSSSVNTRVCVSSNVSMFVWSSLESVVLQYIVDIVPAAFWTMLIMYCDTTRTLYSFTSERTTYVPVAFPHETWFLISIIWSIVLLQTTSGE
jgi:hypothetical protein